MFMGRWGEGKQRFLWADPSDIDSKARKKGIGEIPLANSFAIPIKNTLSSDSRTRFLQANELTEDYEIF